MAFGIGIGSVGGFISAMLIFAFAATLRAAYPPWDHGWPAVLEIVVMALVAATALLTPVRNPESTEARERSDTPHSLHSRYLWAASSSTSYTSAAYTPRSVVPSVETAPPQRTTNAPH